MPPRSYGLLEVHEESKKESKQKPKQSSNCYSEGSKRKVVILSFILEWFKYVVNVFCCWSDSTASLQNFLSRLNNYHGSIKFTMESGGNKINFLDPAITPNEYHNVLQTTFMVHWKPTFSDISIHSESLHP